MTAVVVNKSTKRSERVSHIRREARELCAANSKLTGRIRYFLLITYVSFTGMLLITDEIVDSLLPRMLGHGIYGNSKTALWTLGIVVAVLLISPILQFLACLTSEHSGDGTSRSPSVASSLNFCLLSFERLIFPGIFCFIPVYLKSSIDISSVYFIIVELLLTAVLTFISVFRMLPLCPLPWLMSKFPDDSLPSLLFYSQKAVKGRRAELLLLLLSFLPSALLCVITAGIYSYKSIPEALAAGYLFFLPTVNNYKT